MSLHSSPELDFAEDEFVTIREGKMDSKYFFGFDPSVIVSPPEKEINLPSEDVSFDLTSQQLEKLKKAASVYQLPDISIIGELVLLSWLLVIRKTELLMTSPSLLVRQIRSLSVTSKKRT